jgi:lipoyl(octanoyl) transferase
MAFIQVLYLGRVDYATALQLQETLVELRKQRRIADTLLLLEHPPVITLGRNASEKNIVASPESLARRGVQVFEIKRGGDVTFHGPGQLVGYPIVDLRALSPTIDEETGDEKRIGAVEFVRRIEETLIRTCAEYGISSGRVPGLTGVWTESSGAEPEKKIAAIGVHISRGVTSHGFALNVSTDLEQFELIVPCGISDKPVTNMEHELAGGTTPRPMDLESVAQVVTRQFGNVFGVQILWLESLDSLLGGATAEQSNQDVPNRAPDEVRRMREEMHIDGVSFDV